MLGVETLDHFLRECPGLEGVRNRYQLREMGEVMCFGERDVAGVCQFLEEMWAERERIRDGFSEI